MGRLTGTMLVLVLVLGAGAVSAGASTRGNHLKGLGATIAAMKKAHGVAHGPGGVCSAANSCFGAGLRNDESGATHQFTEVLTGAGLITAYDQNFPNHTDLATAQAEVLQWLPKDAKAGPLEVDHNGGSCATYNVTSPTLASLFSAPAIGDPQGIVNVTLSNTDANLDITYDPNNIQDASFSLGPDNPSDNC